MGGGRRGGMVLGVATPIHIWLLKKNCNSWAAASYKLAGSEIRLAALNFPYEKKRYSTQENKLSDMFRSTED